MRVVPFGEEHLEAAAALAVRRYAALRGQVLALPARYEDPAVLAALMQEIAASAPAAAAPAAATPGVVALQEERMVGYLLAWRFPFHGRPASFSPEWANGAAGEDCSRIYAALYTHMAGIWTEEGCRTHLVSVLPHDRQAGEAWRWLGFGMCSGDGLRTVDPIAVGPDPTLALHIATPEDETTVLSLAAALDQHLAAPPVFLPLPVTFEPKPIAAQLADPRYAHWLAAREGRVIGWLRIGPAHGSAATIIRDPGTASITGAYVLPEIRGRGVMCALLDRALAWARDGGYVRCAVDFEPMNPPAARFWMRWFAPVSYSLRRDV